MLHRNIFAAEFSGKHLNSSKSFCLPAFHFHKQDLLNQFWGIAEIVNYKEETSISPSQHLWELCDYHWRKFLLVAVESGEDKPNFLGESVFVHPDVMGKSDFRSDECLETKQMKYVTWAGYKWECHELWLTLGNFGWSWLLKASPLCAGEQLSLGAAQFSSPSITPGACSPLKYLVCLLFLSAV